jgi:hypothetical protein
MGMKFSIACPKGYQIVPELVEWAKDYPGQFEMTDDVLTAAKDADVIYTDVWASMGQEGEKAARILRAECDKQTEILRAEAEKEATILRADAAREEKIRVAAGEADAIEMVQKAYAGSLVMLRESAPDEAVLQLKAIEAFGKAADGKATKIIIPSEIQGIAGLVSGIKAVSDGTEDTKSASVKK